jgi:hypothetical protein
LSIEGDSGDPLETYELSVKNTGGRVVILNPFIEKLSGTIDDLSWICLEDEQLIVKNDEIPVAFNLVVDWVDAPEGTITIGIKFAQELITSGWYVSWVSN